MLTEKKNVDFKTSFADGISLEYPQCPNGCLGGDDFVLSGSDLLHNIPGTFNVVKCRTCFLERTSPRPTQETISLYYPTNYEPYQYIQQESSTGHSWFTTLLANIFQLQNRTLPLMPPGLMLEVGCSSGAYMESVIKDGWDIDGVEFSDIAATVARNKGLNVKTGSLETISLQDNKYDIIAAWMVIEHLHNPVNVLMKLNKAIKTDGYLVILVPDSDSLSKMIFKEYSYDLQLPTHLYHFTSKSIQSVLAKSGWAIEKIHWQRNCNTLLKSLEKWSLDNNKLILLSTAKWIRLSKKTFILRLILNVLLGITKLSGRMEIWARPVK